MEKEELSDEQWGKKIQDVEFWKKRYETHREGDENFEWYCGYAQIADLFEDTVRIFIFKNSHSHLFNTLAQNYICVYIYLPSIYCYSLIDSRSNSSYYAHLHIARTTGRRSKRSARNR